MTYRVLWTPYAEEQFKKLVRSESRFKKGLGDLANKIDQRLIYDPIKFSESRSDDVRIGFLDPLAIYFELQEDVRTVIVLDVWRTDQR